ncbi:MAG: ABC transporter ATP-binding protein [Alphaproteobacteria bacterium]|nr:ABC transporter ATP-binding protein [Alphaproteobacteria bacterium]
MSPALALVGVSRRYGPLAGLRQVTLSAPDKGVLAVLGASGSGKSTLLRVIAGLEPVDEGQIQLSGRVVSRRGFTEPPEARRVGLVFQDYALFPHMTAVQNVRFGLSRDPPQKRAAIANEWLDAVGLAAKANAYPHELSGGEQQRIALARALAPKPSALLLDEPFSGLDPVLRSELRDLTRRIAKETAGAFVFVTHDAEEALFMADHLAVMAHGRLVQADEPRSLYERPATLAAAAALGPVNQFEGVVREGRLATPFLDFPAPSLTDGTRATAVVRVEALAATPGQRFLVAERRPQGARDLVMVRCEKSGVLWRALIPAASPAMARCEVSAPPSSRLVFPTPDSQS